mmetsp:Transcript_48313/g.104662  ORF Transcript_48313/g.104662 Transcript_48313/m.104662 type:complete len:236 (+) Transcript_48313:72-779(+)
MLPALVLPALVLLILSARGVTASNEAGLAFLAKNKEREGVTSLPSGLQYKIIRAGNGAYHPAKDSPCECHYEGRTAQEFEKDPMGQNTFDSSYQRGSPTSFAPNQVIGGWTEAMQLMVEGDKWELYIPSELAYGDRGSPPKIGGGDVLVFTIEILKIKGGKKPAVKCDVETLKDCSDKEAKYVGAKKELKAAEIDAEMERLKGLSSKKMAEAQAGWVDRRLFLLGKIKGAAKAEL